MATKFKPQPSQAASDEELDWRLNLPCRAIACASIEEAEWALAALATHDDYCAGAIVPWGGQDTAVAYLRGTPPSFLGAGRVWLSRRMGRALGLLDPFLEQKGAKP